MDTIRKKASPSHRVLEPRPCDDLVDHLGRGGGKGLTAARAAGPAAIIGEITAAGLRGRGGAGFPTGRKWQTVARSTSSSVATTVVVNGAEGEPGTLKDRTLLRRNPYRVLEGALIAAEAVGADGVVVCLKQSFHREVARVTQAIHEIEEAGWAPDVHLSVVTGPSSYLFGEETAMLEVIEGRQPFPRIDPPFRRGLGVDRAGVGHSASRVHLAALGGTDASPALVNNVETLANVAAIIRHGADWFRSIGTEESPGTVLCTVTGHTRRHGVGELPMGTTLAEVIHLVGGGPRPGRELMAALSGVANPIIPADRFDTPVAFESMAAIGSGLGAGGFIVFQDGTDMRAVAHGVARFLAIESCGQCEPCKRDGLAVAEILGRSPHGPATDEEVVGVRNRLGTVGRGARCALAAQQEDVVGSILDLFDLTAPVLSHGPDDDEPVRILPLVDIVDGRAVLDTGHATKNPDWTRSGRDSGSWPAARLGNQPLRLDDPDVGGTSGPSGGDDDLVAESTAGSAFPVLAAVHDQLEELLALLPMADPSERAGLCEALHEVLRRHVDVTQRVLYPMVRRVGGAEADDLSWAAERAGRAGLGALEQLQGTPRGDSTAPTRIADVADRVHTHIDLERDGLIPLLRQEMSMEQLDALAAGLNEARVTVLPDRPPPRQAIAALPTSTQPTSTRAAS
jgi:NADH:ubiquinone oxidoreductase subunit F (NADH-binding)/hemerythrin-like domain-containing protein